MPAATQRLVRTFLLTLAVLLCLAQSARAATPTPCEAEPEPLVDGGFKVAFVPDSATAWQPPGGEVRFVLKGDGIPAPAMKINVCFRWHGSQAPMAWHPAPQPRIIESQPKAVTLAVLVPRELTQDWPNWWAFGKSQLVEYSGFGLVPMADMHIVASSAGTDWQRIDVVQQVGVTHRMFALIPAVIALVVAWLVFLSWGRSRGIKGDPLLAVISTPGGVGSLSQFQIMLWTFLIAGGVMYVMALSGSMIDVPQAALGLLGIAGITTLGAKLRADGSAPATTPNPPGAVTGVAVSGTAAGQSVTLTWTPPSGADPTTAYTVQVRPSGTLPWLTAAPAVAAPPFAVTGLTPATAYDFQVFAVTAAGTGPASTPIQATTAAAAAPPAGAPGPISGLVAAPGPHADAEIRLTWASPAPPPDASVVQFRPVGTWAWSTASGAAASPFIVSRLAGNTDYEFQVFAVNAGLAGPPSALATARTAPRTPQWADLVVTPTGEIDVTRVQMLLFTVIAAGFVAMKLFDQNQIPEIPTGILTLMGLSNGLYLAAKFVPAGK